MTDTVTRLMALSDQFAGAYRIYGPEDAPVTDARQALEAELTRLFTPLSDEQMRNIAKVGPVYAPNGWVERDPWEYKGELERARAAGIRIAEQAHGIGETK